MLMKCKICEKSYLFFISANFNPFWLHRNSNTLIKLKILTENYYCFIFLLKVSEEKIEIFLIFRIFKTFNEIAEIFNCCGIENIISMCFFGGKVTINFYCFIGTLRSDPLHSTSFILKIFAIFS